jgi:hypothetical protein
MYHEAKKNLDPLYRCTQEVVRKPGGKGVRFHFFLGAYNRSPLIGWYLRLSLSADVQLHSHYCLLDTIR